MEKLNGAMEIMKEINGVLQIITWCAAGTLALVRVYFYIKKKKEDGEEFDIQK